MRRQSSRFTYLSPEQQITQYLIENPLINAILEDDEEKIKYFAEKRLYDLTKHDSDRQTALHYAAFIGNPVACMALIREGSQIDPKDQEGFTPLHRACAADRNDAVDILLQAGGNAENRNKNWETAWHIASAHGAVSCLERLLPHSANVNIQDKFGRSALHHACIKGHDQVTDFLIQNGVNLANFDKQERRSIHWAASAGHAHVVRLLIDSGAEVNCADKMKCTPIHLAAANGYAQVVEILVNRGADVNVKNVNWETPLHFAARKAHNDCVQLLLNHAAKVNTQSKKFNSPLHYSVTSTSTYVDIDYVTSRMTTLSLLKYGGSSSLKNIRGQTPLHLATKKNSFEQVQLLLQQNTQIVNICDNNGNSALHYAAQVEDSEKIVAVLIECGCDIRIANNRGVTPLHLAAQYACKNTVTRLLKSGSVPTFDNEGRNVLYYAAMGGNKDSFEILRQLDPNNTTSLNRSSRDGKTLLHVAAQSLLSTMIQYILQLTPPDTINAKDKFGRTALHLAATNYRFLRLRKKIESSNYDLDESQLFKDKENELMQVENRSAKCCEILISHGASIEITDNYEMTPLHYACASNSNSSLHVLHKKDNRASSVPLLLLSSRNGCYKTIKTLLKLYPDSLLQKSENIFEADKNDKLACDAIYVATWKNNHSVLELLIDEVEQRMLDGDMKISDVFSPGPYKKNATHVAAINASHNLLLILIKLAYGTNPRSVLCRDHFGRTPLHYAAMKSADDCIEPLTEFASSGAFLTELIAVKDNYGRTVFHYASISGSDEILLHFCQTLDQESVQSYLMMQDNDGKTPLHFAAEYGYKESVSSLLMWCKEAINIHDYNNTTPFVQAIASGSNEVVDTVIQYLDKNNIELSSEHHGRCFLAATFYRHTKILAKLKQCFCQVQSRIEMGRRWFSTTSKKGRTPVHVAAKNDDANSLNILLATANCIYNTFNDDLNKVDEAGMNSLHIAVTNQSSNVIKELLRIGQNGKLLATGEAVQGNSALQLAIMSGNEDLSAEIAKRCSADEINHRNFKGETALHMATSNGMDVTANLLELGADAFAFDDRGRLPLFSHCTTNGGLQALYDIFEHMMKTENRKKISELLGEEDNNDESNTSNPRYVTHLSISDSMDHSSINGRLSLHSSLTSYRRSLSSSLGKRQSSHYQLSEESTSARLSNENKHKSIRTEDEVFDELESY